MISISLSPNLEKDDFKLALRMLFSPNRWVSGNSNNILTQKFSKIIGKDYDCWPINSGRSGLYIILKTLGLDRDSEVIIQALTCIVVPNAIRALGANPVFADVDSSFNLDPKDFERKITNRTKAVIVQHTFGVPTNMKEILKIARKHEIFVIEDCAHSLGVSFKGKPLGTFGDIAFFSFGRDKVISSVFGGMITTKNKSIEAKIDKLIEILPYNSKLFIFKQLLHPIITYFSVKFYSPFGKIIFYLASKSKLLSKAVFSKEKLGIQPDFFPAKLPNALSVLAVHQLNKLSKLNKRRYEIAKTYFTDLKNTNFKLPHASEVPPLLRFPILTDKASELELYFAKKKIYLGDWYKDVVMPKTSDKFSGYKRGSCPKAEEYSKEMLNLPTNPTLGTNDVNMIVDLLSKWSNTHK